MPQSIFLPMKTYCPLWSTIVESSVWFTTKDVKILWITLLAVKDSNGEWHGNKLGLAHKAGLTLQEAEEALRVLESPDPNSTSQEHQGKRIERIDGGWRILNHLKYRDLMSKIRDYNAKKQREYRNRKLEAAYPIRPSKPAAGEMAYVRSLERGDTE
jgi:hypothetical protein